MTISMNFKGALHLVCFDGNTIYMDSITLDSFVRPLGKAVIDNQLVTIH